ncbi:MAG TPA: hypothetical protein VF267_14200 [Gammaproteobacteria bacterium]
MQIDAAQREVRRVYAGGFPGLAISACVWLIAAALGTWVSWQVAMWTLVIGGALIFFTLELLMRAVGHDPALSRDNPLNGLTLQLAFLLPLLLPLVLAAFQHRADWLFPAFMVALGAHFLPFMFLFGMWQFGALGVVMALSGVVFGFAPEESFVIAGWYGGVVQLLFALIALNAIRHERSGGAG